MLSLHALDQLLPTLCMPPQQQFTGGMEELGNVGEERLCIPQPPARKQGRGWGCSSHSQRSAPWAKPSWLLPPSAPSTVLAQELLSTSCIVLILTCRITPRVPVPSGHILLHPRIDIECCR